MAGPQVTGSDGAGEDAIELLPVAPERGSVEEMLDAGAHSDLDAMRHSSAHVMAEAVMDLFPGTRLGIGPAIDDGFYYDFDLPRPLTPDDLAAIEERMRLSVAADHPFVRREVPFDDARALVEGAGQAYKVEILDDLAAKARAAGAPAPETTFYEHGPFTDLCKGPHVASTGQDRPVQAARGRGRLLARRPDAPHAPADLRHGLGDAGGPRSLPLAPRGGEEARPPPPGRGARPLQLPRREPRAPRSGIRRAGASTGRSSRRSASSRSAAATTRSARRSWSTRSSGSSPGHWDHYSDNMFKLEVEDQVFSLKPMNCPESTYIYRSRVRSYRDLPLRLAEYGRLHRNERSGVLSGLTRVRQFVTDDAHIYVRPDQIGSEIEALLGEVMEAYGWFGLHPRFTFGTRPDKALGDPALWDRAEGLMREALERSGVDYRVKPGDGAFYAPKIDIQIEDALGREWQTATIQVDLVMLPERFDLWYIDEEGQQRRPMAIHRAIYGSLERFIGVITEHFAGAFPLWCAPVQAVVIPIADRHMPAADELAASLRARGLRVEVDGVGQPDAEQDPSGPGAEGPVHARPGGSRGRGAHGGAPTAERRPGARRHVGRPRGPARRRGPDAGRLRSQRHPSAVCRGREARGIVPRAPKAGRAHVRPRFCRPRSPYEGVETSAETCVSTT